MNFLITGGAGFIGSHLTEKLLSLGHLITVLDNFSTGKIENLPKHQNLVCLSKNILESRPEDFKQPIDGIVHLAATSSVHESWEKPLETHHNNLSTIMAVIELCHTLKIPRLVFTSSAAIYGNPLEIPLTETTPARPTSPYGLHKFMGEQYLSFFAKHYNFSTVILRLFNVFGERQSPDSPYSGVISIFSSAMAKNLPITIYGDGQQTRDFIYVHDVVNALIKALNIPLKAGDSVTCNIGSGQAISLLDVIDIMKVYFPNWQETINFLPVRQGDIKHSLANILESRNLLDFEPQNNISSGLLSYLKSLNNLKNCSQE